jgi:hypothetical protein
VRAYKHVCIHVTCFAHLIVLDSIAPITLREKCSGNSDLVTWCLLFPPSLLLKHFIPLLQPHQSDGPSAATLDRRFRHQPRLSVTTHDSPKTDLIQPYYFKRDLHGNTGEISAAINTVFNLIVAYVYTTSVIYLRSVKLVT